ncbi:MAG: aspartyl protease family protein [Planctomycetota bacterium]|jgi:membrane-associated protease RseP (regulator of RpoE activity)
MKTLRIAIVVTAVAALCTFAGAQPGQTAGAGGADADRGATAAPRPSGAPARSRLGPGPGRIPMRLEMGRPVIEATINGAGPFPFVLDTGAGVIVLDPDLVEELSLEPTGTTRIGDPSAPEALEASTYTVASVGLGDATFEEVQAVAFASLGRLGARGIIGLPVLYDAAATLDFPNEQLVLTRSPLASGDGSVPFTVDGEFIVTIELDVAGQKIGTHLDTGNMGHLNLPLEMAERLPLAAPLQLIGQGRTVSSTFEVYGGTLDGALSFAGLTLEDPVLQFNDRFPWGNLGTGLLTGCALTIDQVNRRLRIDRIEGGAAPLSAGAASPFGRPRYGMALRMSGAGQLMVSNVVADSIAERAGLQSGDVIVGLNGSDVQSMDSAARTAALRGSPLTLTVERDGRRIEIPMRFPDDG